MNLTQNSFDPYALKTLITDHWNEKPVSDAISIGIQDYLKWIGKEVKQGTGE